VVSSVPVPELSSWHDGRYVAGNMVLAAAGNLEHERIVELAERAFGDASGPAVGGAGAPRRNGQVLRFHQKETEQYHLCLGGAGIPRGDDRRFALRVLDTILGGSTSSRLFQEVREKRGLAYSVYSYASHYADAGQVALYVGTRPDNVAEALDVIGAELRRLVDDGVTADELERARDNVKGRTVLSMESTLTRMNRLGSSLLMDVPLLTIDEVLAAFDAVTLDDVNALARDFWQPEHMAAAGVGGDEDAFRRALEAVSPALAAA
jgi:predicted Zn-dependent peptidase